MIYFIFGTGGQVVVFILLLIALSFAVKAFADGARGAGIVGSFFTVLFLGLFIWFGTTIVVPPNRATLVVDTFTGRADENLRQPGLANIPLLGSQTFEYPAQTAWQWCPVFTPSVSGGAGVTARICFTLNASDINWIAQYRKFNGGESHVIAGWQTEMFQLVGQAFAKFNPRDLTNNRGDVIAEVVSQTNPWWETTVGTVPQVVVLADWDFTNSELSSAYDQALLTQTQIDQASFEQEVARIEQQTAYIDADTQVEVAKRLASGHLESCRTAGMLTPEACVEYLRVVWLGSQKPANLIVSVGGGSVPSVAFPSANTGE